MNRLAACPFRMLAPLGVLVLALSLAACGLKGPLDPPPAATVPPQAQLEGEPAAAPSEAEMPPPPTRKRIFLDWLLD